MERAPVRLVFIKNNIYSKTNFYIEQSRPYFKQSLTRYFNIWGHHWSFLIIFIISFLTPFDPIFALIWFSLGVFCFFFYLQHMYVNIYTMPYVMSQPSLPDSKLETSNAFFIISFATYSALFGEAEGLSISRVSIEGGKIKVQVFRKSAMRRMQACVLVSTLAFFGSIWIMNYSLSWAIVFFATAYQDEQN